MYKNYVCAVKNKSKIFNVIIPLLIVIFSAIFISGFSGLLFDIMLGSYSDSDNDLGITSFLSMGLTILITLFLIKKISEISLENLGFIKKNYISSYLKGALGGAISIFFVFALNALFHGTDISFSLFNSSIISIFIALAFFILQGMYEELLFRLYLMPHFSKALGNILSLILTSAIFMLFHSLNNGMHFMTYLNLFIFGMVFGVVYLKTGNAWIIGAGHSFWNFFLGPILGSNVSGIIASNSIFNSSPNNNYFLLNGGQYGLEGSIITTIIGILIIAYFLLSPKHKKRAY